jgi:hypothetical protein
VFYAFPALVLQIPAVQEKIAVGVSEKLSYRFNVPVKVGEVGIDWLSRLILKDVSLNDQKGDLLLTADHISAGFKPIPLLQKRWVFTTIRLFGFTINLKKDRPDSMLNMQFIIDSFSPDSAAKQSDIDLKINSVLIHGGNINFDIESAPAHDSKFDPNHMRIRNLYGKISLKAFKKDSIEARIDKLSFDEHSGFKLNKMSMSISGNRDSLSMANLNIQLPRTRLQLEKATLHIGEVDNLSQFLNRAPIHLQMGVSQICLKDFSAFIPNLQRFPDIIQMSAKVSGFINDFSLDELVFRQNGVMSVLGIMNLKDITQPEKTYLFGKASVMLTASGLEKIIAGLYDQPPPLPLQVSHFGDLHFSGEISGFTDNLVAYGNLQSDIGSLSMDMMFGHKKKENIAFYMKGKVSSSELIINSLFEEGNPFGSVRFAIDLDASRPVNGSFSGIIKADIYDFDFIKYKYEHIALSGGFKENEYNGSIEIDDVNGQLQAIGLFKNNGQNSEFNFSASLSDFRLDKLNLTDKYENPKLAFKIGADFTGNHIDNFEGLIRVDDLSFLTQPDSLYLSMLQIKTEGNEIERILSIQSDFLNGDITGAYSFSTLISSILNTGKIYLPSLSTVLQENNQIQDNMFSLHMTIRNTETLSNTLKLPLTILQEGKITGQYNNQDNRFHMDALLPKIKMGNATFEQCHFECDNPYDMIQLQATVNHLHKNGSHNLIMLKADAIDDQIRALLSIENDRDKSFNITLSTSTLLVAENEGSKQQIRTEITFNPTDIIIKDSIWKLEPASITILQGNTEIDNFYLSNKHQYLRINGTISTHNPQETLLIDLNDIELDYIFDVINISALQFGGRATGVVRVSDLFESRILRTEELSVQNFSFNQVVQGRLSLYSQWDNEEEGILLMGTIYKNDSIWTDVEGYIYPMGEKEGLSLNFDANDIDLALMHPYIDSFSQTIEGRGYGKLRLFGPFSHPAFEGNIFVKDGRIGVDFLHTDYTFSDTIHVDLSSIQAKDMTIRDKYGNVGIASFTVSHSFFKDIHFDINVQTSNLLIYDTPEKSNPRIYGVVFGDGNVQIGGTEKLVLVQATIRSNPKTSIGFNFMENNEVDNYDFIVFRNPKQANSSIQSETPLPIQNVNQPEGNNTEYRINCMIDVTPDAQIELMMDPASGDKITANGTGNIRVEYGSKVNLAVYGGYTFQSGAYHFSLQQLIRKDFQLQDGSRVDFSGDPLEANLSLNAVYFLTANVEDLDQSLAYEAVRTSVPVNCILNLNGRLQNPDISFDMKFPNSSTELERQVKSVINSDEMMMRQIIYLLALNRFYTPDYAEGARTNEFSRVASSALSAQLSSLLNSLTDKVQIGTNIRSRQDGITDTEVEMLLSSQLLDNRLLFNGNFGYKNNFYTTSAFIGEFDLEYKLTPSGGIRLKAYNHANDMYRYNYKAQTRQGVGIMYNKDFDKLTEIFNRRKTVKVTGDAGADLESVSRK